MMKKGFLKKIGCILLSLSMILTGLVFFSSSVSDAGLSDDGVTFTFTSDDTSVSSSAYNGNTTIELVTDDNSCGGTIGSYGFANCTALTTVYIEGAASIGEYAFYSDTALTSVTFGSVSAAYTSSFSGCSSLEAITITSGDSNGYYTSGGALYYQTTLLYVPAGITSLTILDGTTVIATNAFSDSNVSTLTFEDASDLVTFNSQDGWPLFSSNDSYTLTVNATDGADTVVEDFFDDYVTTYGSTRCILNFDNADDSDTTYTITYNYYLIDSSGNAVTTVKAVSTESVTAGDTPSGISDTTYTYGSVTFKRVTDSDPTLAAATADTTYTYTFQSDSDDEVYYTITIVYQLNDSSGNSVATVTATTLSVLSGVTPSYTADSTYTYNSTTYTLSDSPTLAAATADATYTYTYTASSSSSSDDDDSSSSSTTKYTVTVIDKFYSYDKTRVIKTTTRTTGTYTEGSTYSYDPASYAGFVYFDGKYQSGTVYENRTAEFYYAEDSAQSTSSDPNEKYSVTEGANQTVAQNGGPVRIVCNGPMDKLLHVMVDGSDIPEGNYTLESGSVILTMTYNYIKSLSVGTHEVRFVYTDGYGKTNLNITAGKTTTTVTYTISSDGSISEGHTQDATPTTADGFDIRYLLCLAIFLLGAGAIMLSRQKSLLAIAALDEDE